MSPLSSQAYLVPIEKGLNKLIRMDNKATQQIAALDGAVIAIQSTGPDHTFFIIPTEDGIFITNQCDTSVDAKVTAPAPLLLQLLLAKNKQAMLKETDLMIVGQSSILYQFFNVFDTLNPDWEHELNQWLPRGVANTISQSVKFGQDQLQQAVSLIQSQLSRLFNSEEEINQTTNKKSDNPLTGIISSLQNKFGRF